MDIKVGDRVKIKTTLNKEFPFSQYAGKVGTVILEKIPIARIGKLDYQYIDVLRICFDDLTELDAMADCFEKV